MKLSLAGKPVNAYAVLLLALGAVLVLVFALYDGQPDGVVSQVRIRNQTGMPIEKVEVNGIDYGDIPAGGVSRYRDMESAYTDAKVQLRMNGKRIRMVPEDFAGEQTLGPGHFTYIIVSQQADTMTTIDLQAVKDGD